MSRRTNALPVVLRLVVVLVALLLPLVAAACGNADPFAGLYWEPSSGRRIEIRQDGEAYKLYYGRDLRAHVAERRGDELVVTDPMGGKTVVRLGEAEGSLELVTGGQTSLLERLQQHQ
jgi:hypothetical protein